MSGILCRFCDCTIKKLGNQFVSTLMTKVRFQQIKNCLHCNGNSKMVAHGEENFDKLFKIRSPTTYLQSKFRDILMEREPLLA